MKTLIKNGLVVDPANGVNSKLNLVLEDGKVKEVTILEPECDKVIDATGKIVTPGFIDIHMHEEGWEKEGEKLKDSILKTMLRMGVTTAVGGNCGDNYADPVEYLDFIDKNGSPINMALYAGHGYFRTKIGHEDKYTNLTDSELDKLTAAIKEELNQGLVGVSFGIRYVPGLNEKELVTVSKLCEKDKKIVAAHIRDDEDRVMPAVREFINVGVQVEAPFQFSHIGSMAGYGKMEEMLQLVDSYKENGYPFACDCYPYYAYSTRIGTTTFDPGWLERYKADYDIVLFCEGKYKGQLATKESFDEVRRDNPETLVVCYGMKVSDVDMAMIRPDIMLASDGLLNNGQGHPRAAGTFPRYINNYVKTGKISLYDGINKMTRLQADKLGLKNKGRLNVGADADIVIFDLEKICDKATFEEPTLMPEGISYVIIGGEIACQDNKILNDSLGKSVRRF